MRRRFIRIAQAQINVTVGDLSGNVDKISKWIDLAKENQADIVTFPELAICGYPPEDLLLRRGFLDDNRVALSHVAQRCSNIVAVVGFADHDKDKVFNGAALISDGNIVGSYHKIELPNYGVFDEKRYFQPGDHGFIVEIAGRKISLTICEDIWVPGSITSKIAKHNSVIAVINISGSPFHAGKIQTRLDILARFAKQASAPIFFNNLVGGQDDLVFDGGSLVMSRDGKILAMAERFRENLLVWDIGIDDQEKRSNNQVPSDPLPITTINKSVYFRSQDPDLSKTELIPEELDRIGEILEALTLGLRDYVTKNGFKKVVLGLSGGIDSSLTAAIATRALGPENVIGVTMPSQYTSEETLSDAGAIAQNLGIQIFTIPIKPIYETYIQGLSDALREGPSGVAAENIQARIRGNIVMALSNKFGWLALTTGNKSETAVGYCTLYGDMAGGFAVIKDVPKTVVYEVAERINKNKGTEIIPQSTIERPPSAELKPDQKDEDSLPPYDILDQILQAYVEEDKSVSEIAQMGFPMEMTMEVAGMVDKNEYKRRQAPPGIKITPKAFGRDRRLPMTNRYPGTLNSNRKNH